MRLTYESTLSTAVLRYFHLFVATIGLAACLVPHALFLALVGWQPTHVSLLLGVASLLPAGPGLHGLLDAGNELLGFGESPHGTAARFARVWALSARELWWWWLGAGLFVLVLAYGLALAGADDSVLASAVVSLALVLAVTLQLGLLLLGGHDGGAIGLLGAAARRLVRSPLVALTQVALLVAVALTTLVPVVGPTLPLLLAGPAGLGVAVLARGRSRQPRSTATLGSQS